VLGRRVTTHAKPEERDAALARVEAVLVRLTEARLLDDARFAAGFARSQRERGASALMIRRKLAARGVGAELAGDALELAEPPPGGGDAELEAARNYARRRRLRERYDLGDRKEHDKALAVLARQGFSFEVARRALEASEDE
jgi:regulatory protein